MARAMEWTAPGGAIPTSTLSKVTLHWLIRCTLCLSFVLALLEYQTHSGIGQFSHIGLFFLAGLLVLCGRRRTERMQNLFGSGSFAILITAMLFGYAISYTSHDTYSMIYGLIFIGVIFAARLIVQEIGVVEVVRAYSQAAILTISFLCIFDFRSIMAGTSARFSGTTDVHPNLVAFVLAGFFPVLIWRALEYKVKWRRRAATGLAAVTFLIVFLTGSRAGLFAVLLAGLVVLLRSLAKSFSWFSHIRISRGMVLGGLFLVPLLVAFLLQHNRIGHFGDFLNTSLALNSQQRGLKSGLSGRTNFWYAAFGLLRSQNRWLFGFGYRAGDRLVGTIDNGYVQLLFESGLIAGSMILGCMIRTFVLLWRASGRAENNAWTRYYTMLWSFMVVYFLNNIATRYLFSFGSSFSLCVILMMTASRRELVGSPTRERVAQPMVRRAKVERDFAWTKQGDRATSPRRPLETWSPEGPGGSTL